eukprot:GFUD01013886.1.p1 GENE.GFUD01013886.1~~GFUD01013886.1.p1  ORF type:complete len:388 (+),score=164.83 GFUD01013886.1:36-1199(+)
MSSTASPGEGADQTSDLPGLFSRSVRKPPPVYDYAAVPDRVAAERAQSGAGDTALLKINVRGKKIEEILGENDDQEEDVKTDDKVKESKEIQKHDRMAQVKHEDSKPRQINFETEARTVFVGNLPSSTKKQVLKTLFSPCGKVESVRFRCAARPDMKTTKKVAVIKHTFHEERNNINAYVRMSTVEEAELACSLNNTQVEGLTIRVDMALKGRSHDNKRAIFMGNLDFKTQEEDIRKLFSKCGMVENVRLVRDSTTGIGKGFGYVNFVSEDSVGLAIRLNNQEVCGRKVRVTRAVRKAKPGKVMMAGKKEGKFKDKFDKKKEGKYKNNFGDNKKRFDRSQSYKKDKKNVQPEGKAFQGLSSSSDKKQKRSFNKTVQKNKIIAKKLAS